MRAAGAGGGLVGAGPGRRGGAGGGGRGRGLVVGEGGAVGEGPGRRWGGPGPSSASAQAPPPPQEAAQEAGPLGRPWLGGSHITATELLIVKYDPQTATLSLPFYIAQCWTLGSVLALTWTVWRFFFPR